MIVRVNGHGLFAWVVLVATVATPVAALRKQVVLEVAAIYCAITPLIAQHNYCPGVSRRVTALLITESKTACNKAER